MTRFCLFGAAGDTGNLGVSALSESTLQGVAQHRPNSAVLVFDNGRGRRECASDFAVSHECDGAWLSRRLHRSESLWSMDSNSRFGIPRNRNVRTVRNATAVLDISGGDSFTDLYGRHRWQAVLLPKLITLRVGTPLVLLPQTYGPFADPDRRRRAADVIAGATTAWSRDRIGFESLQDLLGDRFDPQRHRDGVDVAFALPASRPSELSPQLRDWLDDPSGTTTVGLNVSGLLIREPDRARSQFDLTLDYARTVREVANRLLDEVADQLLLVPHVRGASGESDDWACHELAASLGRPDEVQVLPTGLGASQTKWCISQLDWFCGTRMHSTIAALSSGVPAAALAYSGKTQGVFDTCGMGGAVVDARQTGSADAVDRLLECAHRRTSDRLQLRDRSNEVVQRANDQFVEIFDAVAERSR